MPNKIKIKTVFLDMDGVITDFVKGVNKELKILEYAKKWDWWEDNGFTFQDVNEHCTFKFWENLEWMPDGLKIFEAICGKFKPEQIYLLTTPMPNVESATGKWLWVKNNLPGFYKRTIITQAPKHLLAWPDTLLIDDKDSNIDEFRAAGGKVIKVPRPWNCIYPWSDVALEIVKISLKGYQA